MPTKTKNLPSVKECIDYVRSLGYTFDGRINGGHSYYFRIIRPETRPPHNWEMIWTIGEMRLAVKNGC